MEDLLIRPMRADDVEEAERLSADAFWRVDLAALPAGAAPPGPRSGVRSAQWQERTRHFLRTDPGGSWVAEGGGRLVGFATSYRRDLLWLLATYAVRPDAQGAGVGKALLEAAMAHGRGCLRAMLAASDDPRAVRRYRLAGFDLHPQMTLTGRVDRSALPALPDVREAAPGDVDLMDSLDRRLRDAAHGPDHALMGATFRAVVVDQPHRSGYAYLDAAGSPMVVAATDRRTASDLLWECLASVPAGERATVGHVTAANPWALDVGLAARLDVGTSGYLALRGMKPPAPYLHHGAYL